MRTKLAMASIGVALAASFGPVTPANAVCFDWYYQLTGTCTPCHTAGHAYGAAQDAVEDLDLGIGLTDMQCAQ